MRMRKVKLAKLKENFLDLRSSGMSFGGWKRGKRERGNERFVYLFRVFSCRSFADR